MECVCVCVRNGNDDTVRRTYTAYQNHSSTKSKSKKKKKKLILFIELLSIRKFIGGNTYESLRHQRKIPPEKTRWNFGSIFFSAVARTIKCLIRSRIFYSLRQSIYIVVNGTKQTGDQRLWLCARRTYTYCNMYLPHINQYFMSCYFVDFRIYSNLWAEIVNRSIFYGVHARMTCATADVYKSVRVD